MSAPSTSASVTSALLQPRTHTAAEPPEQGTRVRVAYGLAIGASTVIVLLGLLAIVLNDASYSNSFSTLFRLSRSAELDCNIKAVVFDGKDPLPE